jgi:hypothetical protein
MAVPKGTTNNPNGRPKNVPNKATTLAREAIAKFVDGNAERLQGWLDQIAADSPEKAFNCVRDLMEYHLPKMARVESQTLDKNGKPTDTITESDKVILELYKSGKL